MFQSGDFVGISTYWKLEKRRHFLSKATIKRLISQTSISERECELFSIFWKKVNLWIYGAWTSSHFQFVAFMMNDLPKFEVQHKLTSVRHLLVSWQSLLDELESFAKLILYEIVELNILMKFKNLFPL